MNHSYTRLLIVCLYGLYTMGFIYGFVFQQLRGVGEGEGGEGGGATNQRKHFVAADPCRQTRWNQAMNNHKLCFFYELTDVSSTSSTRWSIYNYQRILKVKVTLKKGLGTVVACLLIVACLVVDFHVYDLCDLE